MNAEIYLRSYATFNAYLIELEADLRKVKEDRAMLYAEGTPSINGMPGSSGPGNPTATKSERLSEFDEKIELLEVEIAMYEAKMQDIENTVSRLTDSEQKIARMRYMRGRSENWDRIARELNYSERQCRRINIRLKKKIEKMSVHGRKCVL